MKVGLITICDYKNYGNRLQNYASQEVLKSIGCQVETIVNKPTRKKDSQQLSLVNRLYRVSKMSRNEIFDKVISRLNQKRNAENLASKIEVFKKFTKEHIQETKYIITKDNIPIDINSDFDYFVVGSDQVWNPIFRNGSSIDFLTFASQEKRIAYAPSFGISEIPQEYVQLYKKWLSEFPYLSVRENAGAKIIKDLTGREAQVLVDPTLILTKEKWLSVAKPAKNKPLKNYLLTYFLGGIPKQYKKRIYEIAKKNNLKVINLADLRDPETYIIGPSEFIDFINSASIFCTDSFHGVVFSVIMETPFIVFDRAGSLPSMNSRIDTILSTFKLETRHARNISEESIFDIDFSHVGMILESERNKAFNYLKEALCIISK